MRIPANGIHIPVTRKLTCKLTSKLTWKSGAAALLCTAIAMVGSPAGHAQTAGATMLEVPCSVPVPTTVSPQMAKIIGAPLRTNWNVLPKTGEEWKPVADAGAAATIKNIPGMTERPHDLRDPLLSPVYGDMQAFPPTILTSGTRDPLLSNTVRVHRKLRRAGIDAMLQIYEGQSHAQYYRDDISPEAKEAFEEIAGFDKHLGNRSPME